MNHDSEHVALQLQINMHLKRATYLKRVAGDYLVERNTNTLSTAMQRRPLYLTTNTLVIRG